MCRDALMPLKCVLEAELAEQNQNIKDQFQYLCWQVINAKNNKKNTNKQKIDTNCVYGTQLICCGFLSTPRIKATLDISLTSHLA